MQRITRYEKNINWKKIFYRMFSNSSPSIKTYINEQFNNSKRDPNFYHYAIINLCNPKCRVCSNLTSLLHMELMTRICKNCYEIDSLTIPIIDSWFFKSRPDFIISDEIKSGKYGNCTVSTNFWDAVRYSNNSKFGTVIHIMKDIVIKDKFQDRRLLFKNPVQLTGFLNKFTGNICQISLTNTSIIFANSSIIENLHIISCLGNGCYQPPEPEDAFPCIQLAKVSDDNEKYNTIIRNCNISGRKGTGILVQNMHRITHNVTIYDNMIYNCAYAGICLHGSVSKFTHITNNIIAGTGSWSFQTDDMEIDDLKKMNTCLDNNISMN